MRKHHVGLILTKLPAVTQTVPGPIYFALVKNLMSDLMYALKPHKFLKYKS